MPRKRYASNLAARLITAAVGIPVVLWIDYVGGWVFALAVALAAGAASIELYGMERKLEYRPFSLLGTLGVVAMALVPFRSLQSAPAAWIGILVAVTAASGAIYLARPLYAHAFMNWIFTLIPVLYIGLFLAHLSLLREVRDGAWWVFLVLVITWAYDTGAFFGGRAVGRHPFMQHVSPSKTKEGVAGGLILAGAAGLIAIPTIGLAGWQSLSLGLALGAVAQIGDLVESMIKRQTGVKDSGTIIPGHGGLLDRIDSLLFTGAAAFYLATLLGYAP